MGHYPFTFDSDRPLDVLGVAGRLTHRTTRPGEESGETWVNQRWISEPRAIAGYGPGRVITAEIRFDDSCNNGHNSFAITGTIEKPGARDCDACGCIHDEIAKAFPELAPLIRFHLFDTRAPMHYVANAVYLAGDRDHRGLRKGEQRPLTGPDGVEFWELVAVNVPAESEKDADGRASDDMAPADALPLYRLKTSHKGPNPPAAPGLAWRKQMVTGEGKERDLAGARNVAAWPDATDEELCAPRDVLEAALEARLPALMAEFRAAMDAAGLVWSPALYRAPADA